MVHDRRTPREGIGRSLGCNRVAERPLHNLEIGCLELWSRGVGGNVKPYALVVLLMLDVINRPA